MKRGQKRPPREQPYLCIKIIPVYQVGDPRPQGYVEFFEWARVQAKGGLRQKRCKVCRRFRFPQEKCCV